MNSGNRHDSSVSCDFFWSYACIAVRLRRIPAANRERPVVTAPKAVGTANSQNNAGDKLLCRSTCKGWTPASTVMASYY